MSESIVLALATILLLGVGAQWLAWRIGLPSILLLLTFGIIAGPWQGWLRPNALFGDLLLPVVSIAVALILYEGGLTLKLSEARRVGSVVGYLVSVGAVATWAVTTVAAWLILKLDFQLAALLGAVLVVTGPTVIGPLLRHIRPSGDVGPVLKWEGIVIDPIGAVAAVLILEVLLGRSDAAGAAVGVVKTIVAGTAIGAAAAGILVLMMARYWVADHLRNPVSLMLMVTAFTLSNHVQHESGLLAVTVMGFLLANQKWVEVKHIIEFKENLQVLLISSLFIVLAARLDLQELRDTALSGLLFVVVLVVVARPLCVLVSTFRSGLTIRERVFLGWMAPRGIVAAAVASVFALRLEPVYPEASKLVPITFITIIATVAIYGLTAPFLARRIGVAEANPQGVLFVGAHAWAREIASVLHREGQRVLLVDNNWDHINEARMAGLPTHAGSILAEHTLDEIDLGGIGRLAAITQNDWVNVLAVHRFEGIFGKSGCYQLSPYEQMMKKRKRHKYLHGRILFDEGMTYENIEALFDSGHTVKATRLSEEFDYRAYRAQYANDVNPLFVIDDKKRLTVTMSGTSEPKPGQMLVSLVKDAT